MFEYTIQAAFVTTIEYSTLSNMAPSDVEKLIEDLRAWVDAEYGRRAELARKLGVSRQRVTDWLSGRLTPDLEHGLAILKILRQSARRKRSKDNP